MAGGLHPRLTEKLAEQEGERKDGSRKEGSSVRKSFLGLIESEAR